MLAYNKMLEKNGEKNSKIGYSKIIYLFIYYYYYYYVVIFLCFSIIKESKKGKDKVKDNTKITEQNSPIHEHCEILKKNKLKEQIQRIGYSKLSLY